MNRKYWIKRYEFGNVYDVAWTENAEEEQYAKAHGYERTTQKYAVLKCREESERQKYDTAFSGYASTAIRPIMYIIVNYNNVERRIAEKKDCYRECDLGL